MNTAFSDVFAVPGNDWIIDAIDPETDRSYVNKRDLADVQREYPEAVRMTWEAFRTAAAGRQQTPIRWTETTAHKYQEMLEILPPAYWALGAFLVGEPWDHCFATGAPRFQAYAHRAGRYYVASRALTVAELKQAIGVSTTRNP